MKRLSVTILILFSLLTGCSAPKTSLQVTTETVESVLYKQISQQEAMEMMKRDDGHIIVDVRRQEEFDEGHIPGAILIPNESIVSERPKELKDLNQIILIYCRSGRRSKEASEKLSAMGYKNIYEFGGIITWPGETTRSAAHDK